MRAVMHHASIEHESGRTRVIAHPGARGVALPRSRDLRFRGLPRRVPAGCVATATGSRAGGGPSGGAGCAGAVTRLCRELRIKDEFADDVRQAVTEACVNFVVRDCRDARRARTFLLRAAVTDESLLVVVQGAAGDCHEAMHARKSPSTCS